MENKVFIGEAIKNKRIALNLTSEQLANACGISRSTLFSIENATGNYTIDALISVFNKLSLNLDIINVKKAEKVRKRASRINTKLDKKINRFVIMCVELYCTAKGKTSDELYPVLEKKSVISDLEDEYDFFHTLSSELINDYIDARLRTI